MQFHIAPCSSHASAVSTPLRWILKNALQKASHSCRIACKRSESTRERRTALYKSDQQQNTVPIDLFFFLSLDAHNHVDDYSGTLDRVCKSTFQLWSQVPKIELLHCHSLSVSLSLSAKKKKKKKKKKEEEEEERRTS